jgi:predicted dehydrogenase
MIWVSQVAVGNENNLKIRIYGEKGGLSWNQENPNELIFSPLNKSSKRITRGGSDVLLEASNITRIPAGHPEGYLEGFATIYSEIAESIIAARNRKIANEMADYPSGEDGMRGVIFIESVVNSSAAGSVWVNL